MISAFDARTRSARELLRQVQSKRYSKANPSLKINVDVHDRPDAPLASFAYVDDSEVRITQPSVETIQLNLSLVCWFLLCGMSFGVNRF